MKTSVWLIATALVAGLTSCASVKTTSYGDGWVKTSPVAYRFVAPPLLQSMQGRTYRVNVAGAQTGAAMEVDAFHRHGMTRTESSRADVGVQVQLGAAKQSEPGAMQVGSKWYPAFQVTVPYTVTIQQADGTVLERRSAQHTSTLTFRQMPGFATRNEAVGSIDLVRKLGTRGIEEQASAAALAEAKTAADTLAATLFEERQVAVDVPVVRSASGVDLEAAYELLAKAKDQDQLRSALAAYEQAGTHQVKPDGTPNPTANYGVACGIAAAKIMLQDLAGAWEASKVAVALVPNGSEASTIRKVIYDHERLTGANVIPESERAGLDAGVGEALRGMLSRPGR